MSRVDSSVNIYLNLNYRQKNGGYKLKKVFAEKYYEKSVGESVFEEIQCVGRTIFIK